MLRANLLWQELKQFDFDNVYTNVLDFIEEYNGYILKSLSHGNEAIDRYKSEESLTSRNLS
jgi:hypothetical protein